MWIEEKHAVVYTLLSDDGGSSKRDLIEETIVLLRSARLQRSDRSVDGASFPRVTPPRSG